jgi:DNA repair protein RadA/Sms
VGGINIDEPAADLATVLALSSSYLDRPLGADFAAFGEVGLSGEIRQVRAVNQRLSEIHRLGFRRCLIPASSKDQNISFPGLEIIQVHNISHAIQATLAQSR